MYKEFIIILLILVLVIGTDFITNNYVKDTVKIMQDELEELKVTIMHNNLKNIDKKMENVKDIWRKKYNVLAYYIEHDELEKVETGLAVLGANLEVKENNAAIEDIEETIYLLKHIEEKEQFDFRSIF